MRLVKSFEEFIKEGIVKKISPDKQRAENLFLESQRKFSLLQKTIKNMGIDDNNANDYVEYCYDILIFLLRARMLANGYYASGLGAHEAEVSYLKVLGFPESEIGFTDELRYFRNGILYYGASLDREYEEKVIAFTKKNYPKLRKLVNSIL